MAFIKKGKIYICGYICR